MGAELAVLIALGVGMAAYCVAVFRKVIGQRRAIEAAAAPIDPAIPSVTMKAILADTAAWLPRLRGKIRSIHVVSAPEFGAGGEEGNSVRPNFCCFVIDANGEVHDLASGPDERPLERDAKWLADALGVELELRL